MFHLLQELNCPQSFCGAKFAHLITLKVFVNHLNDHWASQVVLMVRNPPASAGDRRHGFNTCVGKIPSTPLVCLPGECRGQRSLAGCGS